MRSLVSSAMLLCLAAGALWIIPRSVRPAGGDSYEPLPAKFDLPAPEAEVSRWIQELDVREMRRHGWLIFAALTSPSHLRREDADGALPIWETWYSKEETMRPPGVPRHAVRPVFGFPPEELAHTGPSKRVVSVGARIFFNKDARDHVQKNCLYLENKLECLLHKPLEAGRDGKPTPREVPDFPRPSVTLKTSWMHISQSKCTPVPVWDGKPLDPPSLSNGPSEWERKVWVYAPAVLPASCPQGERVPLDAFYHLKITTMEEVASWKSSGNVIVDPAAGDFAIGDYVVLVGFHAATREIPNWVWTTFWWHDRPDDGPFGSDRAAAVRGVWRHYLMDVAYDMDRPWEHDTSPKVTFNPYLEGGLTEGVHANCMTCHRRAARPDGTKVITDYSPDPVEPKQLVVRGAAAAVATYLPDFDQRLKLHFVWTLANPIAPPSGSPPAGCACSDTSQRK